MNNMRTMIALFGVGLIALGMGPVALSFVFPSIALFTVGLCFWAVGWACIGLAILLRIVA